MCIVCICSKYIHTYVWHSECSVYLQDIRAMPVTQQALQYVPVVLPLCHITGATLTGSSDNNTLYLGGGLITIKKNI